MTRFEQSSSSIDVHDFIEITATRTAISGHPFLDASLSGVFRDPGGAEYQIQGFCDDLGGRVYRLRFMPRIAGQYSYKVVFRGLDGEEVSTGNFGAVSAGRKGLVRPDPAYPWHFLWDGTGERYFWNGVTAYWMLGFRSDLQIEEIVDRLARLCVNRVRVTLNGRHEDARRWNEPTVMPGKDFVLAVCPWVCQRPDNINDPGQDVTRFDVTFWQRYERMLRRAREHNIIVDVMFYTDGQDPGADPFGKANGGCPDELRYYQYAVDRLAAFSNVAWNVTNEYHLFRSEKWANDMGQFIRRRDIYGHLLSIHGHAEFPFRGEAWTTHAMYQAWDEHGGHQFILNARRKQEATGRIIPQINEEYGYEDHYPIGWGDNRLEPARNADSRRRLAWDIYMAGGYQTTGETPRRGTSVPPDTGGGWVNGRGDYTMTMLEGYRHIRNFFESFEWWKTQPADDLVSGFAWCLAEPGKQYAIYLYGGGSTVLSLPKGRYNVDAFNPRAGEWKRLVEDEELTRDKYMGPGWVSPHMPYGEDWAFLVTAR